MLVKGTPGSGYQGFIGSETSLWRGLYQRWFGYDASVLIFVPSEILVSLSIQSKLKMTWILVPCAKMHYTRMSSAVIYCVVHSIGSAQIWQLVHLSTLTHSRLPNNYHMVKMVLARAFHSIYTYHTLKLHSHQFNILFLRDIHTKIWYGHDGVLDDLILSVCRCTSVVCSSIIYVMVWM